MVTKESRSSDLRWTPWRTHAQTDNCNFSIMMYGTSVVYRIYACSNWWQYHCKILLVLISYESKASIVRKVTKSCQKKQWVMCLIYTKDRSQTTALTSAQEAASCRGNCLAEREIRLIRLGERGRLRIRQGYWKWVWNSQREGLLLFWHTNVVSREALAILQLLWRSWSAVAL